MINIRPFWFVFGLVTVPFFMCRHTNLAVSEYRIPIFLLVLVGIVECLKQVMDKIVIRPAYICILFLICVVILHTIMLGSDSNFGYVMLYAIYLSICLISIYLHINEFEMKYIMYCYVLSSSIIAALMFFSPYIVLGRLSYKYSDGPAFEPNFLAFYFAVAVIIAIYKLIYFKGNKHSNRLIIGLIVLNVFAILATGSRNALVGVLIASSYFVFFINKISVRYIVLFVTLISIAFLSLTYFIPDAVLNRFFQPDVMDESNRGRLYCWQRALEVIQLRPILGYGVVSSIVVISNTLGGGYFAAHNTYLSLWINLGVLGLLCVFGFFYDIIRNAVKNGQLFCILAVVSFVFMEMIVEFETTYSFWVSIIIFLKGSFISKKTNMPN